MNPLSVYENDVCGYIINFINSIKGVCCCVLLCVLCLQQLILQKISLHKKRQLQQEEFPKQLILQKISLHKKRQLQQEEFPKQLILQKISLHKKRQLQQEEFPNQPPPQPPTAIPTGYGEEFGTLNGENRCAVNVATAIFHNTVGLVGLGSVDSAESARTFARKCVDPFVRFVPVDDSAFFPCALQIAARLFAAADVEIDCVPQDGVSLAPTPAQFVLHELPLESSGLSFLPGLFPTAVIYHQPGVHFIVAIRSARLGRWVLLDDSVAKILGTEPPEPPPRWRAAGVFYIRNPEG